MIQNQDEWKHLDKILGVQLHSQQGSPMYAFTSSVWASRGTKQKASKNGRRGKSTADIFPIWDTILFTEW